MNNTLGKSGSTEMTIFIGISPSIPILLQTITDKGILWCTAGAKGLQELLTKEIAGGH